MSNYLKSGENSVTHVLVHPSKLAITGVIIANTIFTLQRRDMRFPLSEMVRPPVVFRMAVVSVCVCVCMCVCVCVFS